MKISFNFLVFALLIFAIGCNKPQNNTSISYNTDSVRVKDSMVDADRRHNVMKVIEEKTGMTQTATEDENMNSWIGKYKYDESWEELNGRSRAGIEYDIKVRKTKNNDLMGYINMDGFQTLARLICKVEYSEKEIKLYFQSYGKENMSNRFKIGDHLLSLEKEGNKLKTLWRKLTPALDENLNKSNAFKKSK